MTWRPIKTAPKDGKFFVAAYGGLGGLGLVHWWTPWDERAPGWYSDRYMDAEEWDRITHWIPIPPAPKADE